MKHLLNKNLMIGVGKASIVADTWVRLVDIDLFGSNRNVMRHIEDRMKYLSRIHRIRHSMYKRDEAWR